MWKYLGNLEMEIQGNQLPLIEIKLEDVSLEEVNQEMKYPIKITPEHDESEINIKPEFQVHVAVNENENITDTVPEIYNPIELTPFKIEKEENQQIEVKTEYEWLKTNTNTEVNTEYEQSTKAEIEEVNAEYNQAETDQSRSDRMSLEQTEQNQHLEEVSQ